MAKKDSNTAATNNKNSNTNNNVNNNTINNHIIFPESVKAPSEQPTWLKRTVITAIVTIIVSLTIYFGKQAMNSKNVNGSMQNDTQPVVGIKQTKN
jgi:hypothetical protein